MDTLVYILVYLQIAAIAYNIRRNGVQAGSLKETDGHLGIHTCLPSAAIAYNSSK